MAPKRVYKGGRGKHCAQDEVKKWKQEGMSDVGIRQLLVEQGYSKARVSQLMKAAGCKPGPSTRMERIIAQKDDEIIPELNIDWKKKIIMFSNTRKKFQVTLKKNELNFHVAQTNRSTLTSHTNWYHFNQWDFQYFFLQIVFGEYLLTVFNRLIIQSTAAGFKCKL